jgi:hypothetical protein
VCSSDLARGIYTNDWYNISGGDGFYVRIDPTDSSILFSESQGGNIGRMNVATGERQPGSGILEEVGNPDGFLDLDAAFDKSAVSALLDICDDSGSKGDSSVALFIQGSLLDGTQIISTPIGDDGIDQLVRKNR